MEDPPVYNTKGGRPRKEEREKRSTTIGVRFSSFEKTLIKAKAKQSGLKDCEYIRQAAINGKVRRKPTPEEIGLFKAFIGYANNLNQLTKLTHKEGLSTITTKLLRVLNESNEVIKQIVNDSKN